MNVLLGMLMENALEPIAIVLGFLIPCKYKKQATKNQSNKPQKPPILVAFVIDYIGIKELY